MGRLRFLRDYRPGYKYPSIRGAGLKHAICHLRADFTLTIMIQSLAPEHESRAMGDDIRVGEGGREVD